MRSFIAVSGTYDQAVLYLEPTELNLSQGTRVRITGGIFEGVEGVFVRVRHDRRVVVNIEGVMAVATTFVHASLVEEIGEGKTYRIHGKASKKLGTELTKRVRFNLILTYSKIFKVRVYFEVFI